MQPKSYIILIVILFILNSFYGCGGLKKESVSKRYFDLTITLPPPGRDNVCGKDALLIKKFDINPAFDSLSFVYQLKKNEYAIDYYNEFVSSPAGLITEEIEKALCSPDHLTPVQAKIKQNTDFRLSGKITRLYGDFQDPSNPRAVIEIHIVLEKKDGPAFHTISSKTYPAEETISSHGPSQLISGWNMGLSNILIKFIKEFQLLRP